MQAKFYLFLYLCSDESHLFCRTFKKMQNLKEQLRKIFKEEI